MSTELQILIDTAQRIQKSSMIPQHLRQDGELLTAMMFVKELGLPLIAGLNGVTVIQGRPTLGSHLLWAIVMKQPDLKKVEVKSDNQRATVKIIRSLGEFETTFTMEDARTAGLATKDNWKKHPKNMLEARAKSNCARLAYPEAIAGIYSAEEMRDSDSFRDEPVRAQEPTTVEAQVAPTPEELAEQEFQARLKGFRTKVEGFMQDGTLSAEQGLYWINNFEECGDTECLMEKGQDLAKILKPAEPPKVVQATEVHADFVVDQGASDAFDNALPLDIPETGLTTGFGNENGEEN